MPSCGEFPLRHDLAHYRCYNLSWATSAFPGLSWVEERCVSASRRERSDYCGPSNSELRGVRNIAINTRWRRLLRGRKFFTGKG